VTKPDNKKQKYKNVKIKKNGTWASKAGCSNPGALLNYGLQCYTIQASLHMVAEPLTFFCGRK